MSVVTIRVHHPDLSITELQFERSDCAKVLKQVRDGCRLIGGFLKFEGVVVSEGTNLQTGQIYDFTDGVADSGNGASQQLDILNRMVSKMANAFLNPWVGDRDVRNTDAEYRASLKSALNIVSKFVPCMISSQMGGAEQVITGHLIPIHAQSSVLDELQLDRSDLTSTRNVLFLAVNIHRAFERLQLSFVPVGHSHSGSSNFKMVILDSSIASVSIWDGHKSTIGMFADHYLNLAGHAPFHRALAYQAYIAHTNMVFHSGLTLSLPTSRGVPTMEFLEKQQELEGNYRQAVSAGKIDA